MEEKASLVYEIVLINKGKNTEANSPTCKEEFLFHQSIGVTADSPGSKGDSPDGSRIGYEMVNSQRGA